MTPLQQAAAWHDRLGCGHSFAEVLAAHDAAGGSMVATPRVFAMVRAVRADWPEERFSDPRETAGDAADCWHVWLLAGDLREAFRHLPHPLPWMSWHRRGKLRIKRLAAVKCAVERAGMGRAGCASMGSSPKMPPPPPPPPPTPTATDAAQGADRLEEDIRKKRNSVANSFLAGETGASKTGSSTPSGPAGFLNP